MFTQFWREMTSQGLISANHKLINRLPFLGRTTMAALIGRWMRPIRTSTATRHVSSSKDWVQRHVQDSFVQQSKSDNVVSRSYYKLEWMDQKCKLLKRSRNTVIDLGAAPGGWTTYCIRRGVDQVLAVDLLPLDSAVVTEGRRELGPEGFLWMQGDFTQLHRLDLATDEAPTLVLSDMAPNFMGDSRTDAIRCMNLVEEALDFSVAVLGKRGAFCTKFFSGPEEQALKTYAREYFDKIQVVKPPASRAESAERYLVATGFRGSA
jgi:23S rRNA (uridine2552-2'-O)-methyltransferase